MSDFFDDITEIIAAIDELATSDMITMSTHSATMIRKIRQCLYKIQSTAVS
jgi:threonine synthase